MPQKNLIYPKPKSKLPFYATGDFSDFKSPEIANPAELPEVKVTASGYKPPVSRGASQIPTGISSMNASKIINSKSALEQMPVVDTNKSSAFMNGLKKTVPYMSNVANMFSKPDMPSAPSYMEKVSLQRANMDQERQSAQEGARGVDIAADRNLDGNNAMLAKIGGYSQKMKVLSGINAQEQQTNNQIANQETQINNNITSRNLGTKDQFNRDLIDRNNIVKSNTSANIADMSNKFIANENENSKMQLDKDKMKILSRMSPDVWARLMEKFKADGVNVGK